MAATKKDREIRFRASKLDARRLGALAKAWELTPSATLRRLIAEGVRHYIEQGKEQGA